MKDRNGKVLKVGDIVTIRAKVLEATPNEDGANLKLETIEGGNTKEGESQPAASFCLNGSFVTHDGGKLPYAPKNPSSPAAA